MDILSRLGAHAIGTASTVKPIIAPLFLAAPRVRDTLAEFAGETVEPPHRGIREPAPCPAAAPIDQREPLVEMPERTAGRLVPHDSGDGPDDLQPWHERRGLAPARGPLEAPIEPMTSNPIAPESIHSDPLLAAAPDPPARAASDHIVPLPGPVQDVPVRQPTDVSPELARPSHRAAPVSARRIRTEMPRRDAGRVLDRLRWLRESVPASTRGRDPVVRVTIGRIEVRATTPAAPEPAAAPAPPPPPALVPPPRLTLAEYLGRKREAR